MATRGLVGSCLLSLFATGIAAAQVVIVPPPVPVFVPDSVPVVVGPPSVTAVPTADARPTTDQRNYPPKDALPLGPRVIHERHYLSSSTNVSNYMASKSGQTYGPETMVVIRDFYITDEPAAKRSPPPPVGSTEDSKSSTSSPPKNSTDAQFGGILGDKGAPGVKVPNPADADKRNGNGGSSPTNRNYPPSDPDEKYGPPPPTELLAAEGTATSIHVASKNGGTPMAEMELNFVDLLGKHTDVKGRTDGKGQFDVKLAPSRWQVFLVVGENERRSLGVILVKPTPGDPFKLQF